MLPRSWRKVLSAGAPAASTSGVASFAAESNSEQPSVPAMSPPRSSNSFAPGREGGSPSVRTTVASTTSRPSRRRRASSSSTEGSGIRGDLAKDALQRRFRELHFSGGGRVAEREAKASERFVKGESHRE